MTTIPIMHIYMFHTYICVFYMFLLPCIIRENPPLWAKIRKSISPDIFKMKIISMLELLWNDPHTNHAYEYVSYTYMCRLHVSFTVYNKRKSTFVGENAKMHPSLTFSKRKSLACWSYYEMTPIPIMHMYMFHTHICVDYMCHLPCIIRENPPLWAKMRKCTQPWHFQNENHCHVGVTMKWPPYQSCICIFLTHIYV